MGEITTPDRTTYKTTDGEEFDFLHKAKARQAELDIRQMVEEDGRWSKEQVDAIVDCCRSTLIYIPPVIWSDLRG